VDTLSKEQRSKQMSLVRSKNTEPEMIVRRLVFSLGYRYRLHAAKLLGRPDLVFPSKKQLIFVHGCFWHRHDGCRLARLPKSNFDFWRNKLNDNRRRDLLNQEILVAMGWRCLIIWECEIADKNGLEKRIKSFLSSTA